MYFSTDSYSCSIPLCLNHMFVGRNFHSLFSRFMISFKRNLTLFPICVFVYNYCVRHGAWSSIIYKKCSAHCWRTRNPKWMPSSMEQPKQLRWRLAEKGRDRERESQRERARVTERERERERGASAQRKQSGQPGRPRRPIKDADGSELFKLQVWWFLCISCNVDDDDDEDDKDAIAADAGAGVVVGTVAVAVAVAVAAASWGGKLCVCGSNRWNVHVALGIRTWRTTLAPVLVMHWNLISLLALLVAIVQEWVTEQQK